VFWFRKTQKTNKNPTIDFGRYCGHREGSKRLVSGTRSNSIYELRVYVGRDPLTGKVRHISRHHRGGPASLTRPPEARRGRRIEAIGRLECEIRSAPRPLARADRGRPLPHHHARVPAPDREDHPPSLGSTSVRRLNPTSSMSCTWRSLIAGCPPPQSAKSTQLSDRLSARGEVGLDEFQPSDRCVAPEAPIPAQAAPTPDEYGP